MLVQERIHYLPNYFYRLFLLDISFSSKLMKEEMVKISVCYYLVHFLKKRILLLMHFGANVPVYAHFILSSDLR